MRRARAVDRVRSVLQLALVLLLLALFLPEMVQAQDHDIAVPDRPVVNPMYAQASGYQLDSTYDRWWHEVAACEGVELPDFYVLVRYVQINYPYFNLPADAPLPDGKVFAGYSFVHEWQMYVAIPYRLDPEAVKHEMAHFLLFWAHIANGGHPIKYFDGRCGFFQTYLGSRSAVAAGR